LPQDTKQTGERLKANFTSETDSFVRERQTDLKFMIDAEGKVTGFSMNGMPVMKVG
jgi:hypothetical protein